MTRYKDKDGNLSFDEETVARLTKMATDIESDVLPLIDISGLSNEEYLDYLLGRASPETLGKLKEVRFSELD